MVEKLQIGGTSLTLSRRLNAAPEQVYAAWTEPKQLIRWFGPENINAITHAETDVRVGGRFRVIMEDDKGEIHNVSGVYREVVANERLKFTWSWITTPERESVVTVTFAPSAGGTLLTLLHEQLFDEAARDGHTHGWTGSLVKLEAYFA